MKHQRHVIPLALRFGALLRQTLGENVYGAMRRELANRRAVGDYTAPADDLLDANQIMIDAFGWLLGREPDTDDEHDHALWNAAWERWNEHDHDAYLAPDGSGLWLISHDMPPVPTRAYDWSATHEDYYGGGGEGEPNDPRVLYAPTRHELIERIEEYLEEQ